MSSHKIVTVFFFQFQAPNAHTQFKKSSIWYPWLKCTLFFVIHVDSLFWYFSSLITLLWFVFLGCQLLSSYYWRWAGSEWGRSPTYILMNMIDTFYSWLVLKHKANYFVTNRAMTTSFTRRNEQGCSSMIINTVFLNESGANSKLLGRKSNSEQVF